MASDSELEIVIKATNETKLAFAEIQAQLAALTAEMVGSNGMVAATSAASSGFLGLGQALSNPYVLGGLAAMVVVLNQVILAAVGFVAIASLFTLGLGAIVAVGAGLAYLASKTAFGQDAMKGLAASFNLMAQSIGTAAIPILVAFIHYADTLIPRINELGLQLVTWFQARLPGIMAFAKVVVEGLMGAMLTLGTAIGKVVDYVLAHHAQFEGFWRMILTVAVGAITGLLNIFMNLANWTFANWPKIQSTIQAVMAGVGNAINWLRPQVEDLWPKIKTLADKFGDVWNNMDKLRPLFSLVGAAIQLAMPIWKDAVGILLDMANALMWVFQRAMDLINLFNKKGPGPLPQSISQSTGGTLTTGRHHSGDTEFTGSGFFAGSVMAGQRIVNPGGYGGGGGGGGPINVNVHISGAALITDSFAVRQLADLISVDLMKQMSLHGGGGRL